jgi:hypothetical protein
VNEALWTERVAERLTSTLRESFPSVLGYPELAGEEAAERPLSKLGTTDKGDTRESRAMMM